MEGGPVGHNFDEISYKISSIIYTETYIFDTYIFGTDYTILWSVNPLWEQNIYKFTWISENIKSD
jgi:hypothetical protein